MLLPACQIAMAQQGESEIIKGHSPGSSINIRDFAYSLVSDYNTDAMRSAPRLAHPTDTAVNWIDRIYNMPQPFKDFYDEYALRAKEVLDGGKNWLSDPELAIQTVFDEEEYYLTPITSWKGQLTFKYPADLTTEDQIAPFADIEFNKELDNIVDTIDIFIRFLLFSVSYDIPEAFWIGLEYWWHYGWEYNYSWDSGNGTIDYTLDLFLSLKQKDFNYCIKEYESPQAVYDGVKEFNSKIDAILSGVPDGNSYQKARYLNNWLTTHNSYSTAFEDDTKETPTLVWSSMSAIRGSVGDSGPVCEGYSRAFKVLCQKLGIPATLAIGYAHMYPDQEGAQHMWNEVMMDDGKWYGVDVTWNDPLVIGMELVPYTGCETEQWFMLGRNSSFYGLTFAESHPFTLYYEPYYLDKWDLKIQSFIADNPYDVTGTVQRTLIDHDAVTVYSITGTIAGRFNSIREASERLPRGIYIIRGRKIVIQ